MSRCYDKNLNGGFRTTFPVYFLDQVCSHDCMSMDVEETHDETEAAVPVLLSSSTECRYPAESSLGSCVVAVYGLPWSKVPSK